MKLLFGLHLLFGLLMGVFGLACIGISIGQAANGKWLSAVLLHGAAWCCVGVQRSILQRAAKTNRRP